VVSALFSVETLVSTISAFPLDIPTKTFITGTERGQCSSLPSQQADCSQLMCWSHESPGYVDTNSKGKTYFKEKKQTTSSSSEILFSFELMKGVWCSCRLIMLIWHSKSGIHHVIEMQMSLGWISSLGHTIIRIATHQARNSTWLCLHFRLGQKRHEKVFPGKKCAKITKPWAGAAEEQSWADVDPHLHTGTHRSQSPQKATGDVITLQPPLEKIGIAEQLGRKPAMGRSTAAVGVTVKCGLF